MMKSSMFILFTIIVCVSLTGQNTLDNTLQAALSAYENNQFEVALQNFSQIENEGIINADLYYNIGNCYFRLGSIGKSILYYKRALKEKSNHEAARRNFNYALTFTQDKQGMESENVVRSFWKKTYDSFSLNLLASIVFVLFAAVMVTISIMIIRFRGREKTVPLFITFVLIFFLLAFSILSWLKWQNYHHSQEAVLLDKSTIGYSGPGQDFTRVFTIHEGMIFQVERQENGWSLIKLENGLGGWILRNSYEEV